MIARLAEPDRLVRKWDKVRHLHNMQDSGHFRYNKEIVFHKMEDFDAERFIELVFSQDGIQSVFKLGSHDLDDDFDSFRRNSKAHFGGKKLKVMFSYRLRLGVK